MARTAENRRSGQSRHRGVARPCGRLRARGHRRRGEGRQGGLQRVAPRAAAGTRQDAERDCPRAEDECRRARHDRRRGLRQPGDRDDGRRQRCGGANRVFCRPRHRDERCFDPDGPRSPELLGTRAARGGRPDRAVQSSVHVHRRQIRGAARRRQHDRDEAAGAGPTVVAAARRVDRRPAAAWRVQSRPRRQGGRRRVGEPPRRRQDFADRQRADRDAP